MCSDVCAVMSSQGVILTALASCVVFCAPHLCRWLFDQTTMLHLCEGSVSSESRKRLRQVSQFQFKKINKRNQLMAFLL